MSEQSAGRLDASAHVLLRLARLLLAAGSDTEHVRDRVERLAERIGFTAQLFAGSERLLLMVGREGTYRTRIGHAVGAMGIDAGRLIALENLAEGLAYGSFDMGAADAELNRIENRAAVYSGWIVVLAVAMTAASLARLFGAEWTAVGAAFAAGIVSTLLRRWLPRWGIMPAGAAFTTAAISGLVAVMPLRLTHGDPTLALVSAGMILVPGVPLINGVRDLVQGHAAMGVARLANGFVVVLSIATGLAFASLLWGIQLPVSLQTPNLQVHWDLLYSGLAAFGFAVLFNAPRRAIAAIIVCGALGHGARTGMMALGSGIGLATLTGAFLAGVCAIRLARHFSAPWTAFAFPGVVAMVPGSYAFRAMIGGLDIMATSTSGGPSLVEATLAACISACVLTVAIATGLLAAGSLLPARAETSGSARARTAPRRPT